MTNADKYLKDGIDINKFANELTEKISRWDDLSYYSKGIEEDILEFFNEQVKPTLTEDERVILRNIHKDFTEIRKTKITSILQIWNKYLGEWVGFNEFDRSLFQFIKERRRIQHTRIIRR